MLNFSEIQSFFFLGVGGIGMSALARYFRHRGYPVVGYDRTPSPLTRELEQEGITIIYDDDPSQLSSLPSSLSPRTTLVVLTPAVPATTAVRRYFEEGGYDIRKRSEVLGLVTEHMQALCVAGTHGKTTTSTLLTHILYQSEIGTNAFLGGISENYKTNLLLNASSSYVVVEADEYDRSFHRLTPYMSVITAVDPDHLDIYGTPEAYTEAFEHYTSLITGALVMKQGLAMTPRLKKGVKLYTYGVLDPSIVNGQCPDFYADQICVENGSIYFDFHTPTSVIAHMRLGVPVWVNIENSVAAMAVAWLCGVSDTELKTGLSSFAGVYRRFNLHRHTAHVAYVDDYAHHPEELRQSIESVRRLYPERKLLGVFQPHLYTRTRDFADEFAEVLSALDELILLPIYPARELPIPGVSSEMLLPMVTAHRPECQVRLVEKSALVAALEARNKDAEPWVCITLGAGDIDRLVPEVTEVLV